jgi:hypothetical protein
MKTKTIIRALFWGAVLVAFYFIATHIWWVGNGFCFNTADACYGVNQ